MCIRVRQRDRESSAPWVGSGIPVDLDPYRYTVPRQPVSVHSVLPPRTASPTTNKQTIDQTHHPKYFLTLLHSLWPDPSRPLSLCHSWCICLCLCVSLSFSLPFLAEKTKARGLTLLQLLHPGCSLSLSLTLSLSLFLSLSFSPCFPLSSYQFPSLSFSFSLLLTSGKGNKCEWVKEEEQAGKHASLHWSLSLIWTKNMWTIPPSPYFHTRNTGICISNSSSAKLNPPLPPKKPIILTQSLTHSPPPSTF